MHRREQVDPEGLEQFYADAVCGECGSVNPEGTLLCKTCGNNLRDQRMRRVSDKTAEASTRRIGLPHFRWVATILYGVLIAGVIFTGICFSEIEGFFTRFLTRPPLEVSSLWRGREGQVFDDLLERLKANPLTRQEAANVEETLLDDGVYEGRYVIKRKRVGKPNSIVAQAIVHGEKKRLYFLGVDVTGAFELRGIVEVASDGTIRTGDSVGARKFGGDPFLVYTTAQKLDDGSIECYGINEGKGRGHTLYAYRVR